MKPNSNYLLRPLLALSMTLALGASAHAQGRPGRLEARVVDNPATSIQINFGSPAQWVLVPGTQVREVRLAQRPEYDIFRSGGVYYVYSNDQWYMSRRPQGQFLLISDRQVPRALYLIPRDHWRNYPPAWGARYPKSHPGNRGRGHHK